MPHDREPLALVEAARAQVRLVHIEFDHARRAALRLFEERRGQSRAARGRRDAELVEVAVSRIDSDETGGPPARAEAHDDVPVRAERAKAVGAPDTARVQIELQPRLAPVRS